MAKALSRFVSAAVSGLKHEFARDRLKRDARDCANYRGSGLVLHHLSAVPFWNHRGGPATALPQPTYSSRGFQSLGQLPVRFDCSSQTTYACAVQRGIRHPGAYVGGELSSGGDS